MSFSHSGRQNKSFVIKPSYCQIGLRRTEPFAEMASSYDDHGALDCDQACSNQARVLWVACGAHALHDGFTDTLYVLLPLWQAQFALSYAAIGILRALYAGVMAGLQVPVAGAAQRIGGARILAAGTAAAAAAYFFLGASSSVAMLAIALVLGGIGSSTQHPIASSLVAAAYDGPRSRGALGTYNFAGDLGKMALPSLTACLIAVMSWHSAASIIGVIGLVGATAILLLLRSGPMEQAAHIPAVQHEAGEVRDRSGLLHNGLSSFAGDRRHRQRDTNGFPDLSAVSAAGKGRWSAGNRCRIDPAFRRGCCRQACLRIPRGAAWDVADRASDRRCHGSGHCGAAAAALRRGAGTASCHRHGAQWHVIRSLRHRARPRDSAAAREGLWRLLHRHDRRRGLVPRLYTGSSATRSA